MNRFFFLSFLILTNLSTRSIHVVSEDKSLALPGNVVESLVSHVIQRKLSFN